MWQDNFTRIHTVQLVMLSEAPLFGHDKCYFYNPAACFTSFFHFNDAEAILGEGFANDRDFGGHEEKKLFLLSRLAETGFVVLDLFPFALNEKHTQILYASVPFR